MHRYKITKGEAIDLQEWALAESGVKEFLQSLPKLPIKGKMMPGLYVDYEIDEADLDGGIDWPDVGVASVYAVLSDNRENVHLWEVRAYNYETFWLSTSVYDEVDTAQSWKEAILKGYGGMKNKHESN